MAVMSNEESDEDFKARLLPQILEEYQQPVKSITFGIDFDQTFSADPELFHILLDSLLARGHKAVIVTSRMGLRGDVVEIEWVTKKRIPIVFAAFGFKRTAAELNGYKIDVWMDDHPEHIIDPKDIQH